MAEIEIHPTSPRNPASQFCLKAYYAELEQRLSQGFDVNLSRDPDANDMVPPRGQFLLARLDGAPVGCVALKGTGAEVAEIKRLWVAEAARGRGLARRLMSSIEEAALGLGITLLRLDTNSALPEAVALYRATDWAQIPRYNDDPYPDLFFEKSLVT